eukprot:5032357-Amphidinium_carterae.2
MCGAGQASMLDFGILKQTPSPPPRCLPCTCDWRRGIILLEAAQCWRHATFVGFDEDHEAALKNEAHVNCWDVCCNAAWAEGHHNDT